MIGKPCAARARRHGAGMTGCRRPSSEGRYRGSASRYRRGGGAQNRVRDGVGQHVGIGVAFEPEIAGDGHAAQDQGRPAAMRCTSQPSPVRTSRSTTPCVRHLSRRKRRASSMSLGLGDLDIAIAARDHADFHAPGAPPGCDSSVPTKPSSRADIEARSRVRS